MLWSDPRQGAGIQQHCDELFNCATNTDQDFDKVVNYVKKYDFGKEGVAFVIPDGVRYKVFFFGGPRPREYYAYNIGSVDGVPSEDETRLRISFLQYQADHEWKSNLYASRCRQGGLYASQ